MAYRNNWGDRFPLVTNHGHVLLAVAANPDVRIRQIAEETGLTQRTVMIILADLEAAGAITRERVGRRNRNRLNRGAALPDPGLGHHTLGEAADAVSHDSAPRPGRKVLSNLPCAFCGRDTANAGPGAYVEVEVTDPYGVDDGRILGAHTGCLRSATGTGTQRQD